MRLLGAIALGLVGLLACPGLATEVPPEVQYQVEIDPGSVFSTMRQKGGRPTRVVSLQFQIKRVPDMAIVTNLPQEQILVEEDGHKVHELQIYQPREQKLSVVLAIDISGSMARGRKMEEAKQAALTFLEKLDPRADLGLILFDHLIRVAEAPVGDPSRVAEHRKRLRTMIAQASPDGGTAYLDATVRAVELLQGIQGRCAVVVMTDGVDMNSKVSLQEAIRTARIAELPVYTVGIGEPGKNEPVTTVLVLDRSGSMEGRADANDRLRKIDALKRAATRFVELMRSKATTTLLPFSHTLDAPEPFTSDKEALKSRIEALEPRGGTLLYDATFAGVETLIAGEVKGRKAVVVLTDGKDDRPYSRRTVEEVIERAREVKIPLYMLGLGHPREINENVMKQMAAQTGGEYYHAGSQEKLLQVFEHLSIQLHDDGIDESSLQELASQTGGKYTHVSKVSQLQDFYERLAEELQTTYKVTFESRRATHDGTARGIDVKVLHQGKVVSTVGKVDDIARGVAVPQMSYSVYLFFLAVLLLLLGAPVCVRRIYRGFGGV